MGRKKTRTLPEDLGLPPGGADSHAHLNMGTLGQELNDVLKKARACGVSTLINVFMGTEIYLKQRDLFHEHNHVFFILGVHPHEAGGFTSDTAEGIHSAAQNDIKIKGIGETGLDFYYKHSTPQDQKSAFKSQLQIAKELDLPVVIHSRDAFVETFEILGQMGFKDRPVLWHCFGQGKDQAEKILSMGWNISIPGSVTFKKNHELHSAVQVIPAEKMLIETDCPFLAPEPYRGKENQPALLGFTAQKIAQLKDMDINELWVKCGQNCRNFFSIHEQL